MENVSIWRKLFNEEKPIEAVEEFIKVYPAASFIELKRKLGSYMPVTGDQEMILEGHDNLILWSNLSKELCDILSALLSEKRIYMKPTPSLVYMVDGGCLNLPILKRKTKKSLKTPHWLPVVFYPGKFPMNELKKGKRL